MNQQKENSNKRDNVTNNPRNNNRQSKPYGAQPKQTQPKQNQPMPTQNRQNVNQRQGAPVAAKPTQGNQPVAARTGKVKSFSPHSKQGHIAPLSRPTQNPFNKPTQNNASHNKTQNNAKIPAYTYNAKPVKPVFGDVVQNNVPHSKQNAPRANSRQNGAQFNKSTQSNLNKPQSIVTPQQISSNAEQQPAIDVIPAQPNLNALPQKTGKGKNKENKLRVVFLGGVGEIGKNMTLLEYGNDIIIIDCGVTFPTSYTPGIDLIIPDFTYLKENVSKIKGLLLTHGHEDHIGAVPFLAKTLPHLDVYGSSLTLALVDNKLGEHNAVDKVTRHPVSDGDKARLGVFSVEFVRVTHSVAGSLALAVTTPVGVVYITGDFKVDYTPRHSLPINLPRIAEIGNEGVLLLLAESTNVEREGYTLSESVVADKFRAIFEAEKNKRIIIATFSSNVDRLQEVFDLAKEYGRKVAISGRSMLNVIETASSLGYVKYDKNILVRIEQTEKMRPQETVVLSTGSQGEPMSALTRMASGDFNKVSIGANDTIIISATPIPGNEKDVYNVINNLYKLGAKVVYSAIEDIHVSGHACKEELKMLHSLLKPKFFIPVHGEYRHLYQHKALAEGLGMNKRNVLLADLGDVAELTAAKIAIKGKVTSGSVLIDGSGVGDVGTDIIRDRLSLAEDGIVIVTCGVEGGIVTARPQVFSRGCFSTLEGANMQIVEEIKALASDVLAAADLKKLDLLAIKSAVTKQVRSYFRKKFKRFPMILVVIMSSELDE